MMMMGGEQEKSSSSSSSSKKRTSLTHSLQLPNTKKRVVLAQLTNNSDLHTQNPKRINENDNSARTTQSIQTSPEIKTHKPETELEGIDAGLGGLHNCTYSSSIYNHLHSLEIEDSRRPLPNYMEKVQNDVSVFMREVLVDWLVEVTEEYKLVSDTLYLTISYIDRFLSSHTISKNKLQLLGVSCMLVASKYQEISPPHVEDFCYITDNTYIKEEVVEMEKDVLKFLNFEMSTPTIKSFLRIFTRAAQENCKTPDLQFEFLGCYLSELSLLEYGCVQFLPSVIAASVVFLSRFTVQPKMHPWSMALQCCSGYRPSDLKECVLAIHDLQLNRRGSSSRAVRDKYMQHKYKCVASLSSPLEVPAHYFEAIDE